MQSILAIPFVIPPVAEAAGEVAPSADGAFLLSFAAEPPSQPRTGEEMADATGVGIVPVLRFPFALAPGIAGPIPDGAVPETAGAIRGQAGLLPDAGLQGVAVAEAVARGLSAFAEGRAVAEDEPQDGAPGLDAAPKDQDADTAAAGAPGSSASLHGAEMAGGPELARATSPGALTGVATVGTSRTSVAEVQGYAATSMSPVEAKDGSTVKSVAGSSAVPSSMGLTAGPMASSPDPARKAEHERILPASMVRDAAALPASIVRLDEDVSPAAADPGASGAAEASGPPLHLVKAPPPAHEASGVGAAKGFRALGRPALVAPETAARSKVTEPSATTATPGGENRTAVPVQPEKAIAPIDRLPSDTWTDTQDIDPVAAPSLPTEAPEATAAKEPGPSPVPRPEQAANAAGFWERLLTGLSVTLPGDQALAVPVDDIAKAVVSAFGAPADRASDPPASVTPASSVATDRMASGLAVFARGQAQLVAPATELDVEVEPTDLPMSALSALPGASVQGLSQPQASTAGSTPLPVPQVAAQITAALSQSADGATELALSPEELGNVRLRLERDARNPDRMVVHITFERPETLDLFRRHAGELAEALRESGYAGADIGFGQQDSGAQTPDREPGFAAPDYVSGASGLADARAPEPSPPRLMAGNSLDLRL